MPTFPTLQGDHDPERSHKIDAGLGGLDEEIRRHRAIAADITRPPAERETARTTARTIWHCVYLLKGKSLVVAGIAVIVFIRRFRRVTTVATATAGLTAATVVSGATPLTPSLPPRDVAAPPAATAPTHHRAPTHTEPARHRSATTNGTTGSGADAETVDNATQLEPQATPRPGQQPPAPTTHATTQPTNQATGKKTVTVVDPGPTVVTTKTVTTRPTPTTPATPAPTTEAPPQPRPTTPAGTEGTLLHVELPLPATIRLGGLLGIN